MISVSAFTFFSFNAGPTLYFHTGTPGPVPYRNAKALTCRLLSESLISTLDEVMNIQREGREKRREAEAELRNMENELKAKLLEIRG